MDRVRRNNYRRRTVGASASPRSPSEASLDLNPSAATSPVVAHTNTTPQSAHSLGRRSSKSAALQHHNPFTFSPPGPNRLRKRSSAMDSSSYAIVDDEDGPKKGGHSLRKRARVDYTFEHNIEDDVLVPSSSTSARGRKRRSDANYDTEGFWGTDSKRRGASMGADTPSNKRKNPSRKSSEMKAYHQALEDDDNEVQDTIEVGVSYSDLDESESRVLGWSSPSSHSGKAATAPHADNLTPSPSSNQRNHPSIEDDEGLGKPELNASQNSRPLDGVASQPTKPAEPAEPVQPTKVDPDTQKSHPPQTPPPVTPTPAPAAPIEQEKEKEKEKPVEKPVEKPQEPVENDGDAVSPRTKQATPDKSEPADIIKKEAAEEDTVTHEEPQTSPQENEDKMDIDPVDEPVQDTEMTGAVEPAPESVPEPTPTQPAEAEPKESEPVTEPETAEPTLSGPKHDGPKPDESKAEGPKANESKAEDPKPDEAKDDEPADARPVESQSMDLDPKDATSKALEVEVATPQESTTSEVKASTVSTTPPPPVVENDEKEPQDQADANANRSPTPPPVVEEAVSSLKPDEASVSDEPPAEDEAVAETTSSAVRAATPPVLTESETLPPQPPKVEVKQSPQKQAPIRSIVAKPQPAPVGRWAHLTPYIDGEFVIYPESKGRSEEDAATDDQTPDIKDADRDTVDMEPMVEDNDDNGDPAGPEAPTPALNTPTRGSPVPDSADPTTFNSPAPGGDDGDDDVSESQEPPEARRCFKYRKLRDPDEYLSAIENYEDMSTTDLYEIIEAMNVSLSQWQQEWTGLGKIVDDYENSLRRRLADTKYESRTRNLHQHGVNYEEPDFAVKGYRAREREGMTETRYLQGQDRIMAATYGFEYDPHPSKIGKQNPETQQAGVMTRGRSLRNQPRQTAKATETEEVTGKRQRKPVLLFDPAVQDVSRSSTPAPATSTRGRRRKNANADDEVNPSVSFNTDMASDGEASAPKTRRRRGRGRNAATNTIDDLDQDDDDSVAEPEEPPKPTRRGRGRPAPRYEEVDPNDFVDEDSGPETKQPKRMLTLKIPRGKHFSEPSSSAIANNGDSRPSTADSDSSSHTAESSYSFRPKRQKRFRDDPDETEETSQQPPKKRGKRASGAPGSYDKASTSVPASEQSPTATRKIQKIKVVRSGPDGRNGGAAAAAAAATAAAAAEEGDEPQKDYKSMTKSEKMSASMKNRWANGNMAGAVEKRKATLAAKKAAQAAAEQKLGVIAPKPKSKAAAKKEAAMHMQQPPPPPPQPPQQPQSQSHHQHQHHHQQQQQQHHQPHPHHQHPHHQHHQHQHPHHQHLLQQQQQQQQPQPMHQHPQHPQHPPPPHPGSSHPGYVHGMPGMGGYY